jgi:hypothetical protein
MRNTGLMVSKPFDEIYTPKEAINSIIPYLSKDKVIWECCYGNGDLKRHFEDEGFKVVGEKGEDFFNTSKVCDVIITNPPYSNKRDFIEEAKKRGIPFAFLVPITTLEGKKSAMIFHNIDIQLIIPKKRINFLEKQGKKGSWFAVMWLTHGLNLPKSINYELFAEELK